MVSMRLFDTTTGAIRPFEPGGVARIYICGITPYDATHMGHAATYVTYDVLHRRLVDAGVEVRMVRNITDIDNDLLARARRDKVNYLDLAFGQKRQFDDDLRELGNLEPWSEPRATSAIPDIRGLISRMLDSGAAYESGGWVYFSHTASANFGTVSRYSLADMGSIGEQRGEDPADPRKRHPLDTVLWQTSADAEPAWESPWGRGRPGWHIECTALAIRELGGIDLHGGGCDLLYPHHEFSAAQLDAADIDPVGHWMHQACVHLDGEPMSKSTGNLVFVRDLLEMVDPMALRLAVLSQHYRTTQWDWQDSMLEEAANRLTLWRSANDEGPVERHGSVVGDVRNALDDDLNVPAALAVIDRGAAHGRAVRDAAQLLGVTL